MPERVYRGVVRTWGVPAIPTSASANALLDEIAGPASELWEQSEITWDGSNHVATLTARAGDLEEQIHHAINAWCADSSNAQVEPINCHDWLGSEQLEMITADTTDDEIDGVNQQLHENTHTETTRGVVVIDGLTETLIRHRDELRDAARENLEEIADRLDLLSEERNDLISRIYAWGAGDTDRSLALIADVSRATVARIRGSE